jgi:diaminopimelate decarboxylase
MLSTERLSGAFPQHSRLDERGRLQIGGCDAIELAREFGTPVYAVADEDLRARARTYVDAFRTRHADFAVAFGAKANPCTAVLEVFAEEGLWCDVASAGELALALAAGFSPERLVVHGNARTDSELELALRAGAGLVVIDNFDDIDRLERLTATTGRAAPGPGATPAPGATGPGATGKRQDVLVRVTPGVRPGTHAAISTGQADSKFGLGLDDAARAIERVGSIPGLELLGLHVHVGSQLMELEPFVAAVSAIAPLGDFPVYDLGGGLGVAYGAGDYPPAIEDYVAALVQAVESALGPGKRIVVEPGRSLVANACVTLYTVVSVKRNVSTWVAVDGGMSDNLRPMLYGARYEAQVADRFGDRVQCRLVGRHCESGDVLVHDAALQDPAVGDVVVTPATGAYGLAMANNYNGIPRPPVVFCRDGEARLVVRRETPDDLRARDVR